MDIDEIPVPASLKILVCFALILVLNRSRLPLSLSLLGGAVALGLWAGMPLDELIRTSLHHASQWTTVYLIITIIFILFLGHMMEKSGHLNRIVYSFVLVVKDRRAVSALVPALIGLLPLPGGALFSAPLVRSAVEKQALSGEQKTIINYWFRHVWEYWWPLYPGFILAVSLLAVPAWRLMIIQFPLTIFAVTAGVVFLLLPIKMESKREGPPFSGEGIRSLLKEVMPLVLLVATIFLVNLGGRALGEEKSKLMVSSGLPILLGMLVAVIWVVSVNRIALAEMVRGLADRKYLSFSFLVIAIMIFKGVLGESGMVQTIKNELVTYHIPSLLIVALLPFISGLVTGIAFGFVGASFPVILPLISGLSPLSYLGHACLAYGCGYMGMMLSPIHLCFLVSKDYFHAGFGASYRLMLKPVILVLILTAAYFFLLTR